MRLLTATAAREMFLKIGMTLGPWNQISDIAEDAELKPLWFNRRCPSEARSLYVFAHHVVKWLPQGEWKVFHIDNSTSLRPDETFLLGRVLGFEGELLNLQANSSLAFDSIGSNSVAEERLAAVLTYFFLLFEQHAHLVSAGSQDGEHLSIQDGFVYFQARTKEALERAKSTLDAFDRAPLLMPSE